MIRNVSIAFISRVGKNINPLTEANVYIAEKLKRHKFVNLFYEIKTPVNRCFYLSLITH